MHKHKDVGAERQTCSEQAPICDCMKNLCDKTSWLRIKFALENRSTALHGWWGGICAHVLTKPWGSASRLTWLQTLSDKRISVSLHSDRHPHHQMHKNMQYLHTEKITIMFALMCFTVATCFLHSVVQKAISLWFMVYSPQYRNI